jgi:imidazolonepropionase-like amidohydrolase
MMNAVRAGVATIEHGDGASDEVLDLMAERGVALFPTLAAGEAIAAYAGWRKGQDPEPARIAAKRRLFRRALDRGVPIGLGSDVGVFSHGRNAWELSLLVEYGMSPLAAMRAATSVNADLLGLSDRGRIREGLLADLVATEGDPTTRIEAAWEVRWVLKVGEIERRPGD